MRDPKVVLKHGDDMRVEIEGIGMSAVLLFYVWLCAVFGVVLMWLAGTLINEIYYE